MENAILQQANFLLPEGLLKELRSQIPRGEQSHVVAEAIEKELKRRKLESALSKSFGAWSKGNHPELKKGIRHYIRNVRQSSRKTLS